MFNTLMRLLSDSNLDYLQNRLTQGIKTLSSYFNMSNFVKENGQYVLTVDVDEDATAKNVNVDYDDETRLLTVKYELKKKNFSSKSVFEEALPEDADEETINATIADGKLTITVDVLPEVEEVEPEPEEDETVIKINRKRK